MASEIYDITIEQGATFPLSLVWKDSLGVPVNLTGYTARMQLRETYTSATPIFDLTSAGGAIVLGGALGTIVVTASATITGAITIKRGVYDLELTSPLGVVTRLIEGTAYITPEVTR